MGHTHRYKFGFRKKNQVKSPSIWSRTPNSVRIRQSGRTGNRGVTEYLKDYDFTLHYHSGNSNVVADALNQKSRGVLASVTS